jgi:hypothetical protein
VLGVHTLPLLTLSRQHASHARGRMAPTKLQQTYGCFGGVAGFGGVLACTCGTITGFLYMAMRGGDWLLLVTVIGGAAKPGIAVTATPVKTSRAATPR